MSTTQPVDLTARFTLDEGKAAEWLARIVEIHDAGGNPENGDDPEFGATWEPATPDEEGTIDRLVYAAGNNGVIAKPPSMDLFFNYSADGDGGQYSFLVDVGSDWVKMIRLSSLSAEMRKIVHYDTHGIDAALSILRQAVANANAVLGCLAAFVAEHS